MIRVNGNYFYKFELKCNYIIIIKTNILYIINIKLNSKNICIILNKFMHEITNMKSLCILILESCLKKVRNY
jgi:hypothetical protein